MPPVRGKCSGARAISLEAQKVLRYLISHEPKDVARLHLREATHRELEDLLQAFLQYILEQELKSTAFLRRLRSELALQEAHRVPKPSAEAPGSV